MDLERKTLEKKGFRQIRVRGSTERHPEYLGIEEPAILVAKHIVDGNYILHTAVDSYGRDYSETQINDIYDSEGSIEKVVKYLLSPSPQQQTQELVSIADIESEASYIY